MKRKFIITGVTLVLISYYYVLVTGGFNNEDSQEPLTSTKTNNEASNFKLPKMNKVKYAPMIDPLKTNQDRGAVKEIVLKNLKLNQTYFARMNNIGYQHMHTLNLSGSNFKPNWLLLIIDYKKNITTMHLDGTLMTNTSLSYLVNFPNLENLDLMNSSITAKGLKQLARLKNLKRLNISKRLASTTAFNKLREALPKLRLYNESVK